MKTFVGITILLLLLSPGYGQDIKYFKKADLEKDLLFIAEKIRNVQNAPFLYCKEEDFDQAIKRIQNELPDSMTVIEFCKVVEPLLKMSGDEHARILSGDINKLFKKTKKTAMSSVLSGIEYEKFGKTGILTVKHFMIGQGVTIEMWQRCIDSLATEIRKDRIRKLLIDVSNNRGGSSKVGDLLIAFFCHRPYRSYSFTWRRSDEYLNFMKSLNWNNSQYEALKNGEYFKFPSRLIPPEKNIEPYRGKLWVAVGENTFSSAIIFATLIKDNKLAYLIGETPRKGHPNHFGEMIFLKTPCTGVNFGFGVKNFIRPSGEIDNNILEPDMKIDISKVKTAADWVPYLKR